MKFLLAFFLTSFDRLEYSLLVARLPAKIVPSGIWNDKAEVNLGCFSKNGVTVLSIYLPNFVALISSFNLVNSLVKNSPVFDKVEVIAFEFFLIATAPKVATLVARRAPVIAKAFLIGFSLRLHFAKKNRLWSL